MKCKKCKKLMKSDPENKRYICKCGEIIKWVSALKQDKLLNFYF